MSYKNSSNILGQVWTTSHCRACDDSEHGAGVWSNCRLFSDRRRNPQIPPVNRSLKSSRFSGALLQTSRFVADDTIERTYSQVFEFDLSTVQACVAGPKLPQSRVALKDVPSVTKKAIGAPQGSNPEPNKSHSDAHQGEDITDGDIVIAAITSCTNTSNPSVMVAAGLLAKNARERGLTAKPWVKTSLSPGSRKVTSYLSSAGLLEPLEGLGFHVTGYGCMTCCGGSGALSPAVQKPYKHPPNKWPRCCQAIGTSKAGFTRTLNSRIWHRRLSSSLMRC